MIPLLDPQGDATGRVTVAGHRSPCLMRCAKPMEMNVDDDIHSVDGQLRRAAVVGRVLI